MIIFNYKRKCAFWQLYLPLNHASKNPSQGGAFYFYLSDFFFVTDFLTTFFSSLSFLSSVLSSFLSSFTFFFSFFSFFSSLSVASSSFSGFTLAVFLPPANLRPKRCSVGEILTISKFFFSLELNKSYIFSLIPRFN